MCTLFTSVLVKDCLDLLIYLELSKLALEKNHSTVDHLFVLNTLIELYCKQIQKTLYCALVDYSKAFDLVPRVLLWSKLLSNNINGNILDNIIRNMYASAKSFVRNNDFTGELYTCGIGVRQGENLLYYLHYTG